MENSKIPLFNKALKVLFRYGKMMKNFQILYS